MVKWTMVDAYQGMQVNIKDEEYLYKNNLNESSGDYTERKKANP